MLTKNVDKNCYFCRQKECNLYLQIASIRLILFQDLKYVFDVFRITNAWRVDYANLEL